ncbi:MAG: radical SAM protein [Polyangiaceae bacterium]|nr:radical SAM protein [Polyangiaceae bacterium]
MTGPSPTFTPRTAAVVANRRCNQACSFCEERAETDDEVPIDARSTAARLKEAAGTGAEEICVTGGEPTLRTDLPLLVAGAKKLGARRVVLETNATLVDETRAEKLRAAGLDVARVHISGWGDAVDAITKDAGGFSASLRGIRALIAAGVELEIVCVVVRSTAELVSAMPEAIVRDLGTAVRALIIAVPLSTRDPDELLSLEEAAAAALRTEGAARAVDLPTQLHPRSTLVPCLFSARERPHHWFSLPPSVLPDESRMRTAACASCEVAQRCGGIPKSAAEPRVLHPVRGEKARRRLTLVGSVRDQIDRELVSPNLNMTERGKVYEEIIRTNFRCNQSCRFCFVSTHLPDPRDEAVRAAIRSAGERGARIALSGGEPTLSPRLAEYIRLASEVSNQPIQLQTNAIRLDDSALVRELVDAGLREAFVSLHGATAETSDAVTEAPGTFARTVVGLDNLMEAGVHVTLNFVVCGKNLHELVALVRLARTRWRGADLNISFVAPSTDLVPRDPALVPRYSEALPVIAEAVALAGEIGVHITGFESMCGLPLCLVPGSLERYATLPDVPEGFDRGEFEKPTACSTCSLTRKCYGVRRGYAEMHGTSEVQPVRTGAISPQP